jgi:hypothetical protein
VLLFEIFKEKIMNLLKQPLTRSSRFACLAVAFAVIGQFALPRPWSDVSMALAMAFLLRSVMVLFPDREDRVRIDNSTGR